MSWLGSWDPFIFHPAPSTTDRSQTPLGLADQEANFVRFNYVEPNMLDVSGYVTILRGIWLFFVSNVGKKDVEFAFLGNGDGPFLFLSGRV